MGFNIIRSPAEHAELLECSEYQFINSISWLLSRGYPARRVGDRVIADPVMVQSWIIAQRRAERPESTQRFRIESVYRSPARSRFRGGKSGIKEDAA